ncbi:HlyD family efflux transporter periplasmic adaptor subunit [Azohydromonas lata]|uniref:HlyD family efflux transporter periplasmic adaptor subunit n=1 Tax=Azohydromonas lata TaxID=45677 RepID=A0ABU5ILQ7_9BURK|nr:HlyD family efflux transporter periplasmic adaptor subunit [Azohydromonas lata]MDZ5459818.1 HlyD family efflux transporter periplasmic adaptor subunit [Azohydromonas lata]
MAKKKAALLVLLLLLLLAGVLAWRQARAPADTSALTLHGNVDIRQVSLAFQSSERVAEMRVEEGDVVQGGQVLAVLETRTAALRLQQAQAQVGVLEQGLLALRHGSRPEEISQAGAQVAAAQAEAERARLQVQRLEGAAAATEGRGVSPQDLDNARAQARVAQARLDAARQAERLTRVGPRTEDIARAEAQLRAAQVEVALLLHQIELAELKAPRTAVVRARLLEPGDMASPSRPAYTLALTDPKWVRAYVGEPQLGRLRPGMVASVSTDAAPAQPVAGRIGFISSVAEFTPKAVQTEELRTDLVYEIRVLVDDPQDRLRLGMPATVRIPLDETAAAPAQAASKASQ